jgi:diacylglycerol kinase (ATP)
MEEKRNYLIKRFRSFRFAFKGVIYFIKSGLNAKIHLCATLLAICLGFMLRISLLEWCLIIIVISIVLISEITNTIIEKIVDILFPDFNETAGRLKDLSAAAVLLGSIVALITGLIIFVPKLF